LVVATATATASILCIELAALLSLSMLVSPPRLGLGSAVAVPARVSRIFTAIAPRVVSVAVAVAATTALDGAHFFFFKLGPVGYLFFFLISHVGRRQAHRRQSRSRSRKVRRRRRKSRAFEIFSRGPPRIRFHDCRR
jgi:hypothetical protein